MSRYAYFTCPECRTALWLGKTIFIGDKVSRFQIGQAHEPLNSENEQLNRTVWKFLADHAGHPLRVLIEGDPEFELIADYREIGGDERTSISFDDYLRGWSG